LLPVTELRPDSNGVVVIKSAETNWNRFTGVIDYQKAVTHVKEGSCGVIDSNTVVKFLSDKQMRRHVFKRDKGKCHYCRGKANTLDHKLPRSKGGCSTPVNLVACCNECNQKKKNMSYIEYMTLIGKEVKQ
jgi:5-methylcytosine-specific restriction endonuclease McrA